MNTGELLERVYQAVGYKDRYYVLSLLNDALTILTDAARLEKSEPIDFVDGTAPIPEDFSAPSALYEGQIGNPTYIYDLIYPAQNAVGYSIVNGTLVISPPDTKTLNLHYYKLPTELVDDEDTPDIPVQWHSLLSLYASAVAGGKDDFGKFMGLWESGRASFTLAMTRRHKRGRVREVNNW